MKKTIIELYNFQVRYLMQLLANIPDHRLFEKQDEGFNSPGWLLGHLCVEAEDVLKYLDIPYKLLEPQWFRWFSNSTGKLTLSERLPMKIELITEFEQRYSLLAVYYMQLTGQQMSSAHPSKFLEKDYSNLDSWFSHHLTTHLAIHCGNLVVWKKLSGIDVEGF